jgi:hypothetical protein
MDEWREKSLLESPYVNSILIIYLIGMLIHNGEKSGE